MHLVSSFTFSFRLLAFVQMLDLSRDVNMAVYFDMNDMMTESDRDEWLASIEMKQEPDNLDSYGMGMEESQESLKNNNDSIASQQQMFNANHHSQSVPPSNRKLLKRLKYRGGGKRKKTTILQEEQRRRKELNKASNSRKESAEHYDALLKREEEKDVRDMDEETLLRTELELMPRDRERKVCFLFQFGG
jgi:hypothetical protein